MLHLKVFSAVVEGEAAGQVQNREDEHRENQEVKIFFVDENNLNTSLEKAGKHLLTVDQDLGQNYLNEVDHIDLVELIPLILANLEGENQGGGHYVRVEVILRHLVHHVRGIKKVVDYPYVSSEEVVVKNTVPVCFD